jgi:hypothetical protein
MRAKLLALALAATVTSPALAEPVLPFAPFLLLTSNQSADAVGTPRTGGDSRDSVVLRSAPELRPLRRPAVLVASVRTAVVSRKIVRLPWSTGVFQ